MKREALYFIYTLCVFVGVSFFVVRCADKDDVDSLSVPKVDDLRKDTSNTSKIKDDSKAAAARSFFDQYMETWYLWRNFLPTQKSTEKDPIKYFSTLLYKRYDRFSIVIEEKQADQLIKGITPLPVFGIRFKFLSLDDQKRMVLTQVDKNSNAYKLGMRRASIIDSISGVLVSQDNYADLLSKSERPLFSFRVRDVKGLYTMHRGAMSRSVFQQNPILMDSVLRISGKQVGYFYYSSFLGLHEQALKNTFQKFMSQQVEELIVDLRYNRGGLLPNVKLIADALAPVTSNNQLMIDASYNSTISEYLKDKYGESWNKIYFNVSTNNLNLKRVYFLVTGSSASASELLINALIPYMDVITVGSKTYGKPVGATKISDPKGGHKYAMFPITTQYKNASGHGAYFEGLSPKIAATDDPRYALLDANEPLFKAAVDHIQDKTSASSYENMQHMESHQPIISEYSAPPFIIEHRGVKMEIKR